MGILSSTQSTALSPVVAVSSRDASRRLRVVRVSDWRELENRIDGWHELLGRSLWPNPCYSPGFLIPLLKHRNFERAEVWLVESTADASEPRLLGLMPIVRSNVYRLPLKTAAVWRPDFAFDGTPLLDEEEATFALAALLASLKDAGYRLLALDTASAEPQFARLMEDCLHGHGLKWFTRSSFTRAALAPSGTFDEYCRNRLSKNRRKKIRRQIDRLSHRGELTFERSSHGDEKTWVADFMSLEASGWKGQRNSAILSEAHSIAFFEELVDRFAATNDVSFVKVSLDDQTLAMLVDLRMGDRVYGFKTAFNESFADCSPGLLIEFENLKSLHSNPCGLFDACSASDNELLNSLYSHRLAFQDIVIGLTPSMSTWVRRVMPTIQSINHTIRRG